MAIYNKMYLSLFNAVKDALALLPEKPDEAAALLVVAQQECEEMYIENDSQE